MRAAPDGIDALEADHQAQRALLADLERLAASPTPAAAEAARLAAALPLALTLHLLDEEEDLFPLLRRRATEEDGLAATLDRLEAEHVEIAAAAAAAVRTLARLARGEPGEPGAIATYVGLKRRHAIFENAVVTSLARVRLSPADRRALAARLAARRATPPRVSDLEAPHA